MAMHYILLIFDLSGGELFLIVLAIIVLFGPKQIPVIARSIGKVMHEIRTASNQIRQEVMAEARTIEEAVQPSVAPKKPVENNKPVDKELQNEEMGSTSGMDTRKSEVLSNHNLPGDQPGTSSAKTEL